MRADGTWRRRMGVVAGLVISLGVTVAPLASAHSHSSDPPAVTTCATLAKGSHGAAVKQIQKEVGTTKDGDFGSQTKKALKSWQKAHSLPASGVVDAATWDALPAGVAKKACSRKVHGTGVDVTCASLSSGASGLAVIVLQTGLGITADGQFGHDTTKAVKDTQRAAKLKVTGVTNTHTWKAVGLRGTPACSTHHTVAPHESKDQRKQDKIRSHVDNLVTKLLKKSGTSTNQVALQAMAFANKQIGKPYIYGGTGPKGYDCSGLQMKAYQHAGLTIPRTAAEQYAGAGVQKPLNHAKQGDLMFFASDVSKPSTVYHVVMYVGNGQVLEAPYTGANVRIVPLWSTDLMPVVVRPVANLDLPAKSGDSGFTVTQLQQDLNRHGADLTVDGGYGSQTKSAVKSWQRKQNIKHNGVVHVATWLTLG
jgi:cell wall-associated NlpC family hydrolase